MNVNVYIAVVAALTLLLGACSTTEPHQPEWRGAAQNALNGYIRLRLEGHVAAAIRSYANAIERILDGGDLDGLHIVILTRCAMDVALLKDDECREFSRRAVDARAESLAYFALLRGTLPASRAAELPQHYRDFGIAIAEGRITAITVALHEIEDPVSHMIATGIAQRMRYLETAALADSAQIARMQGWRAVYRTYEETRAQMLETAGRHAEATKVRAHLQALFSADTASIPP